MKKIGFFFHRFLWLVLICVILFALGAAYFLLKSNGEQWAFWTGVLKPHQVVLHMPTPEYVHGIYMTSWVAGTKKIREPVLAIFDTKDVNTVVIDIKDATGKIAFLPKNKGLIETGAGEDRMSDIDDLIKTLHEKGVYVIGRVAAFQDPYMAKKHPEWSVESKKGGVWKDRKGETWVDAGAKPMWDYLISIANESYARGFDEINFDYIRFPTDGDLPDMSFKWDDGKEKAEVIREFFQYVGTQFQGSKLKLSADLFGLTTVASGDLGIGQVLGNALPYFDYVMPMVYPSHFADGWNGYKKPAEHPFEVITESMQGAIEKAKAASTSPDKLRPWLQDFSLATTYTPEMVRDQIRAADELGLKGWIMWDPSNKYTLAALPDKVH